MMVIYKFLWFTCKRIYFILKLKQTQIYIMHISLEDNPGNDKICEI